MGELNKIVGGLCGALLAFLGLNFFAEQVFHPHHEEELAFALDIETDAGEEEVEEEIDMAALFAAADPAAGERVFRKCSACHKIEDGANGVGPHLWGVVGRDIGAVDGFNYSGALPEDQAWTAENLYAFLEAPRDWAPGTSMSFNGLAKPEEKANLIAYLNEADGTPIEFEFAEQAALDTEAETATDAAEAPAEEEATEEAASDEAAAEEEATEEAASDEATTEEEATEEDVAAAPAAEEAPASEEAASEDAAAPAEESEGEAATEEAAPAEEETDTAMADEAAEEEPAAEAGGSSTSPELLALLESASAEDGAKVFRKCQACHKIEDGANGVGPHLWGVVGRPIASVDGYRYSDALPADEAWTADNLNAFLEKPRDWAPGTKMSYAGLRKAEDRAAVIKYLNEADGTPEAF